LARQDGQITQLTKEKEEALNALPKYGEVIGPGRRMSKLYQNIQDMKDPK
jgi:hypothetical protein